MTEAGRALLEAASRPFTASSGDLSVTVAAFANCSPDDILAIEAEAAALERERLRRAARLLSDPESWDQSAVLDLLAEPVA